METLDGRPWMPLMRGDARYLFELDGAGQGNLNLACP
jgi:hypothetical protein